MIIKNVLKEIFTGYEGKWTEINGPSSGCGEDKWFQYTLKGGEDSIAEVHINIDPENTSFDFNIHVYDNDMITFMLSTNLPESNRTIH